MNENIINISGIVYVLNILEFLWKFSMNFEYFKRINLHIVTIFQKTYIYVYAKTFVDFKKKVNTVLGALNFSSIQQSIFENVSKIVTLRQNCNVKARNVKTSGTVQVFGKFYEISKKKFLTFLQCTEIHVKNSAEFLAKSWTMNVLFEFSYCITYQRFHPLELNLKV